MFRSHLKPDEKPIFTRKGALTSVDFIFCCLNSAISFGILKLGAVFTSGLITTYLILIVIAVLTYYSLKLYVMAAAKYHESTFEEIWRAAFSKRTLFIPIISSIFSSLVNMITYLREIQSSIIKIWYTINILHKNNIEAENNELESYKMLIGCAILIIFIIPYCVSTSIQTMAIISYLSTCCVFIFILYIVFMFAYLVKENGFDPTHSLKLCDFGPNFGKSLLTLIFAFEFYPLTYPGLRNVQNSTQKNLLNAFKIIIIILFIIYTISGTFCYLTFYDLNNKGIILDYFPSNTTIEKALLIIGQIVVFVFVLNTIPFRLNSCRYIILNTFNATTSFPLEIWAFTGIVISIFALALSNLTVIYLHFLEVSNNVMAAFLLYIIPPILYIKAYKASKPTLLFTSILLLIIGIASVVCIIYYKGFI